MKRVSKLAVKSSLASRKCDICPIRPKCDQSIVRVCHDAFVEGFKKGVKAAEKEMKEQLKHI